MKPEKFKQGFQSKKQRERLEKIKGIYDDLKEEKELETRLVQNINLDHSYDDHNENINEEAVIFEDAATQKYITRNDWNHGRRVVELDVLAQALSGCMKCGLPLQLSHAISIKSYGLSALLKVSPIF